MKGETDGIYPRMAKAGKLVIAIFLCYIGNLSFLSSLEEI